MTQKEQILLLLLLLLLTPSVQPVQSMLLSKEPHPPSSAPQHPTLSPQSPPLHTLQSLAPSLRHSASPPHPSAVAIAISAAMGQTDRRLTGTHSRLVLQRSACSSTSCPPTLHATDGVPPAEQKASLKVPHLWHTRTTSPYSTASRTTTYLRSVCSARGDNSSCSDSCMCRPYTQAASCSTICSRISMSFITAAEAYDFATGHVSE
ncbi:uncharacterized protein MONOS_7031 [Monocercomonoides exilis]|uniref:uncharacterized protein n=1 Tax=Monocercomonoides exilis TaxID=2049356 RepID=UPI0035594AAE|nr:hypothetical protein MONOS_7031 [Monocercomonoides exilis]|eukprot:MONOS_7031.1-p1 / transcript=MONOS_7031.1 / gene=MONOS_7031 / organism=Monocercomonoides_exilis_PA203 / gene_product=unspecified product / transcript_product=unspecified product / location=Mono_scaffold00232:2092-2709(-) / protein_length=206 / sequence_SO=supercontig / SO=protein_coding / is_pseudo=false